MVGENDFGFVPDQKPQSLESLGFVPDNPPKAAPDMSGLKPIFRANLGKKSTDGETSIMDDASKFLDDVQKGWGVGFQGSATGLASRGKLPEELTPEEASTAAQVASGIGQFVGDLPVIVPSLIAGAAAAGPVGAVVASSAAPAAVRSFLIDKYKNGELKSGQDLIERGSGVLWDTIKETAVGVATMGAGKAIAPIAGKLGGGLSSKALQGATEVATMATVGKGLEGELPGWEDFTVAGLTVGTMHVGGALAFGGTKKVAGKLGDIYAKTGIKPEQVVADAKNDAVLTQELLMEKDGVPSAYVDKIEPINTPEQDLYHGTAYEFDKLDFEKTGGMISFAEDKLTAMRYAEGGGGGRKRLKYSEMLVQDEDGVVYEYQNYKNIEKTMKHSDGTESKYKAEDGGEWVATGIKEYNDDGSYKISPISENRPALSTDEIQERTDVNLGDMSVSPKSARVISQKIDPSKVLDVSTKDGAKKFSEIFKPKSEVGKYILEQAKSDVFGARPGDEGLNNAFWSKSKHASSSVRHRAAIKEITSQLKAAGYDGIRFRDDSHMTVGVFEPSKKVTMREFIEEPKPELDPNHIAVREIMDRVVDRPEVKKELGDTFEKIRTTRQRYLDAADPLKKMVDELSDPKKVKANENPFLLKRMESDYIPKAVHAYKYGQFDIDGNPTGHMALEAIEKAAPSIDVLTARLIAKHDLDYRKRDLKSGFSKEATDQILSMRDPKGVYEKLEKATIQWGRDSLSYARDSQVVSKDGASKMMAKNEFYVPFQHDVDAQGKPQATRKGNILKRTKGNESEDFSIIHPFVSMKEMDLALKKLSIENQSFTAFREFAEKNGIELNKVEGQTVTIDASPEIKQYLESRGIDANIDAFTVMRKGRPTLRDGQIDGFIDGKYTVLELPKDLEAKIPGISEAMKSYVSSGDYQAAHIAMKVAQSVTQVKRFGITATPAFKAANFIRDNVQAFLHAEDWHIPFRDSMSAMYDIAKETPDFQRWMRSGGMQGSFLKLGDDYFRRNVIEMHEKAGIIDKAWNVVKSPADMLSTYGQLLENATRLAEFKRVSKGAKAGEDLVKGGFAARDISTDFEMHGTSTRMAALSSVNAFFRATINGTDKTIRAFSENPGRYSARAAVLITTPTVLLYIANRNNPLYQNLPQWRKDLFWNVPVDNWVEAAPEDYADMMPDGMKRVVGDKMLINKGWVMSIPRPHLPGVVFGAGPERMMDKFFGENPQAFNGFASSVIGQTLPSMPVSDVLLPAIEQVANKSFFSGRPIVPRALEHLAPELQYTNYTHESAKQLAKVTPYISGGMVASPMVVENYLRSWGGPLGQATLSMLDLALEPKDMEKPDKKWFENPIVGSFVARNPDMGASSVSNFYDKAKEVETTIASFKKKNKLGIADDDDVGDFGPAAVSKKIINKTKKAIGTHRKIINSIYEDKEMKGDEKRQLIDGHTYMMIEESKRALERINELERSLKESQAIAD